MINTGCFLTFDKTKKVEVLGKKLLLKNYCCSPDGVTYREKAEHIKIRMSICPTSFCPANCRFCIADNTKNHSVMDLKKLEIILQKLKKDDRILCISFTGGEPFYDIALLNEALSMVFEIMGENFEVSISTNGMALSQIHKLKYLPNIDTIHVSRHHYNDKINNSIFGMKMPSSKELKECIDSVTFKDIFVFNCMLQKDYIGTPDEAHRFLDYAISQGAAKVSFITCQPINNYAKEQTIPFEDVIREDDESLLFTRGFNDFEYCHCKDGVYTSSDGSIIEFYGRTTSVNDCTYCRGITYCSDSTLRVGYKGEVIL